MKHRQQPFLSLGFVGLLASLLLSAQTPKLDTVRVIALPSRPLPVLVAQRHGIFTRYGLNVEFEPAITSDELRMALAKGTADIAHAAVDNDVAMVENAGADTVIVMGGEGSLNELIAQPEIHSVENLRGSIVIVDAPNTAFALQLKKILLTKGLLIGRDYEMKAVGATPLRLVAMRQHKEYAASMLGPPTSTMAKHDGFVSLGTVQEYIGAYQGIGGFVRRQWARQNSDLLVRYIAAYIEAQRWIMAPSNRQQVIEILVTEFHLPPSVAEETYVETVNRPGGPARDAGFDLPGFKNVLKLRAEVEGQWGGKPPAAEKYYDLGYYKKALAKLK